MAQMPLNKYIAHAGYCSRRKAVEFITQKKVLVNDRIVTEPGYKLSLDDVVVVNGQQLRQEVSTYILLNKPKNCVATVSDERGRKTVIDAITGATKKRVYPVGRLDRNTTGLLLLTNDGALAQWLAHPRYRVQKIYHVHLERVLAQKDLQEIQKGIELSDGMVHVDKIAYLLPSKKKIKLTLHIGKYRIIRRLFDYLGYTVTALDRVQYAHFTKRGLPRGAWRIVSEHEIQQLYAPHKTSTRRSEKVEKDHGKN